MATYTSWPHVVWSSLIERAVNYFTFEVNASISWERWWSV